MDEHGLSAQRAYVLNEGNRQIMIRDLVQMGFSSCLAAEAVEATNGESIDRALDWLLANACIRRSMSTLSLTESSPSEYACGSRPGDGRVQSDALAGYALTSPAVLPAGPGASRQRSRVRQ